MKELSVIDMFNSKVHFGHLKRYVSPKMAKYIYCLNNNISIINLDYTLKMMIKSLNFIENIVKNNGVILFVGSKRQASKLVELYSNKINMPYINNRWLGGLLTNFNTIQKSVKQYNDLEQSIKLNKFNHLTKKEILILNKKLKKLRLNFKGISKMNSLPDALFVIDVNYEVISILEASKLSIPIIGVVDTNSNPDKVDYIIPGNDDSTDSINYYLDIVSNHVLDIKKMEPIK